MANTFGLITDPLELSGAKSRTVMSKLIQIQSMAPCTFNSFGLGTHEFPFQVAAGTYWMPALSYMRLRMRIGVVQADGVTIRLVQDTDNIAPAMDMFNCMLSSCEFQIAGTTISRCQNFVAQSAQFLRRSQTSDSWQNTVLASQNLTSSPDWETRRQAICHPSSARYRASTIVFTLEDLLADNKSGNVPNVAIDNNAGDIWDIEFDPAIMENPLKIGDKVSIKHTGNANFTAWGVICELNANVRKYRIAGSMIGTPADAVTFLNVERQLLIDQPQYKSGSFELICLPPLSIFDVSHALPSMSCLLRLTPKPTNSYAISALNTKPGSRLVAPADAATVLGAGGLPLAPGNFVVTVEQMQFYCQQIQSDRMDSGQFYIDLKTLQVSSTAMDNTPSLQMKTFNISPSTYELGWAVQDARVGQTTQYPCDQFVYWRRSQPGGIGTPVSYANYQDINRWYIQYSNQTYPSPDADPTIVYPAGRNDTSAKSWSLQQWFNSTVAGSIVYNSGGANPMDAWIQMGMFYGVPIYKDPAERSTIVNLSMQVANATSDVNLLMYAKSRQVVTCRVAEGLVTEVNVQDQ